MTLRDISQYTFTYEFFIAGMSFLRAYKFLQFFASPVSLVLANS